MHQTRYWPFFLILTATRKTEAIPFHIIFSANQVSVQPLVQSNLASGAALSPAVKASKIWHQQGGGLGAIQPQFAPMTR